MDTKAKELVLLGASVAAHCFPCFDHHLEQARKLEICEADIRESIRAGFMVMNGAGDKMKEKIEKAVSEITFRGNESCVNSPNIRSPFHVPVVRF